MPMRRAELEEIAFGHGGDVFAEDADGAGVRSNEAVGELHQDGLSAAGRSEDDARLAALHGEGDVLEDRFDIEGDRDVVEDDDRLRRVRVLLGVAERIRGSR